MKTLTLDDLTYCVKRGIISNEEKTWLLLIRNIKELPTSLRSHRNMIEQKLIPYAGIANYIAENRQAIEQRNAIMKAARNSMLKAYRLSNEQVII